MTKNNILITEQDATFQHGFRSGLKAGKLQASAQVLQELLEQVDEAGDVDNSTPKDFIKGWNACVDLIQKKLEENQ